MSLPLKVVPDSQVRDHHSHGIPSTCVLQGEHVDFDAASQACKRIQAPARMLFCSLNLQRDRGPHARPVAITAAGALSPHAGLCRSFIHTAPLQGYVEAFMSACPLPVMQAVPQHANAAAFAEPYIPETASMAQHCPLDSA